MNLFFKHWKPEHTDQDRMKLGLDWGSFPVCYKPKRDKYFGYGVCLRVNGHEYELNLLLRGTKEWTETTPDLAEKKIF